YLVIQLQPLLFLFFFLFKDPAPTDIYTLSLHDALPISTLDKAKKRTREFDLVVEASGAESGFALALDLLRPRTISTSVLQIPLRSEEHTSELQSPCNLVCRLLLEKKKHNITQVVIYNYS